VPTPVHLHPYPKAPCAPICGFPQLFRERPHSFPPTRRFPAHAWFAAGCVLSVSSEQTLRSGVTDGDAFYVGNLARVSHQLQKWRSLLPNVEPHYGELSVLSLCCWLGPCVSPHPLLIVYFFCEVVCCLSGVVGVEACDLHGSLVLLSVRVRGWLVAVRTGVWGPILGWDENFAQN
jgi:hypothetical protein